MKCKTIFEIAFLQMLLPVEVVCCKCLVFRVRRVGVCVVDALRDALAQVKELSRQIPELHAVKVQLETERDALKIEVSDLQDALKDALARLDAANNSLTHLRTEMERRLHEKDEEIDGIRSGACDIAQSHSADLLNHCSYAEM